MIFIKKQKKKLGTRVYDDRLAVAVRRMNVVDIPKISDNPELLANCFMQHEVQENGNGVWLQGEVTGVDKVDNRNTHLTTFSVRYKDDDDIYTCRLIKDMVKGDCFVQITPWK